MIEEGVCCLITQIQSALSSQDAAAMGSPHLFTYLFWYTRAYTEHTFRGWGRLFITGPARKRVREHQGVVIRTRGSDSLSDKSDVGRGPMNKECIMTKLLLVPGFLVPMWAYWVKPSCGAWDICVDATACWAEDRADFLSYLFCAFASDNERARCDLWCVRRQTSLFSIYETTKSNNIAHTHINFLPFHINLSAFHNLWPLFAWSHITPIPGISNKYSFAIGGLALLVNAIMNNRCKSYRGNAYVK